MKKSTNICQCHDVKYKYIIETYTISTKSGEKHAAICHIKDNCILLFLETNFYISNSKIMYIFQYLKTSWENSSGTVGLLSSNSLAIWQLAQTGQHQADDPFKKSSQNIMIKSNYFMSFFLKITHECNVFYLL